MNRNTAFVIFLTLAALAGLVVWIRHDFGAQTAAITLLALSLVIAVTIGIVLALMVQRTTLNAIVDFQAADDRGEIARSRMLTEVVRNAGRIEHEAQRQQNWYERLTQKQLPAPAQAQVPAVWEDADTVDASHRFIISE
jgi:hypothetical protein